MKQLEVLVKMETPVNVGMLELAVKEALAKLTCQASIKEVIVRKELPLVQKSY